MKKIKFLLLASFLLTFSVAGKTQSDCYIQLGDLSGFNTSTIHAELEDAACDLISLLPQAMQSEFKIYDFGYYVYNSLMTQSNDANAIWNSIISQVDQQSSGYLLFGREGDQIKGYTKIRVKLKLPANGIFTCLDAEKRLVIENVILNSVQNTLNLSLENGSYVEALKDAEINSMVVLKAYIEKFNQCCANGIPNPACATCKYLGNEIGSLLNTKGFLKLNATDILITDFQYTHIQSSKRISFLSDGQPISLTDGLEEAAGGGQSMSISVRIFDISNCSAFNSFPLYSVTG